MTSNIRIYITQIIAVLFTYTAVSEILKVSLLLVSLLFTLQKGYIGFLEIKDRREKKKQLKDK